VKPASPVDARTRLNRRTRQHARRDLDAGCEGRGRDRRRGAAPGLA